MEAGESSEGQTAALRDVDVDDLLREVRGRVDSEVDERARWELLLEAVVGMAADLTLDGLLERIVAVAGRLAGAQYAALGVLDVAGRRPLRTFVHQGMDATTVREIGDLPSGHGLLGLVIDRPEPLRLPDIAAHPESYGFPPHHPPMTSFLGAPVRTRDKVFGNLYLTEKEGGGSFTEQDERIVVALAAAAGVAIENAQLYDELRQRDSWMAATAEIGNALLESPDVRTGLQLVADRARELSGADVVWIVSGTVERDLSDLQLQVVSGSDVDPEAFHQAQVQGSLAAEVARTGARVVVEDLATDPRVVAVRALPEWPALGPAVYVPLDGRSGFRGALVLAWATGPATRRWQQLDPALPASFAAQAALTLHVVRAQADSRRLAIYEDRHRIGRDLHDLVIQRLFALGLSLQTTNRLDESPQVRERIDAAVDALDETIKEIRTTIFALATEDSQADFKTEVGRLIDRAAATLKFRPSLSFVGPVGSVVGAAVAGEMLAVLSEMLSNTARHAQATRVSVVVRAGDDLALEVTDNGRGVPSGAEHSGLANMRRRAENLGGSCTLTPGPGNVGTRVLWCIPVP